MVEFLSKSLVATGIMLALPAAIGLLISGLNITDLRSISKVAASWFVICASGLFLLYRAICFVRDPSAIRNPRRLWILTTVYLTGFAAAGSKWLCDEYVYAKHYELTKPVPLEFDPTIFFTMAVPLVLPALGAILALLLAIQKNQTFQKRETQHPE